MRSLTYALLSAFALNACAKDITTATPGPADNQAPAGQAAPQALADAPKGEEAKTGADLMDPKTLNETAPATYKVKFNTTKGDFVLQVNRDWAPNGADRFYNLVKAGYYKDIAFFRVITGFMAQFGIHGDPNLNRVWRDASIADDAGGKQTNKRGTLSFATRGPNTRTVQLFINLVDNGRLDSMGFTPFAEVVSGMEVVDKIHAGYGEGAPRGMGPDQGRIQAEGNAYLKAQFPELDYLVSAEITE